MDIGGQLEVSATLFMVLCLQNRFECCFFSTGFYAFCLIKKLFSLWKVLNSFIAATFGFTTIDIIKSKIYIKSMNYNFLLVIKCYQNSPILMMFTLKTDTY